MSDLTPEQIAAAEQAAAAQAATDQAAAEAAAAAEKEAAEAAADAQAQAESDAADAYKATFVTLKAPDKKASLTFDGVTYTANAKGLVQVPPAVVPDCLSAFGYSLVSE